MHLKGSLIVYFVLIHLSNCLAGGAYRLPGDSLHRKGLFSIELNAEYLRSTHTTYFNGFSFSGNYELSKKISVGIGFEKSYCNFHPDNNWNLYDLHFNPLFLKQNFKLFSISSFDFYSSLREGISFIKYQKEEPEVTPGYIYTVKEKGFFGNATVGISKIIFRNLSLHTEVGFKAYHISSYDLEVNPHGISYQGGVMYYFPR